MDSLVRISKVESIPKTRITDKYVGSTGLFTVQIKTCVVSGDRLLIQTVHVSNVLALSSTCAECEQVFSFESLLQLHMESHSKSAENQTNSIGKITADPKTARICETDKDLHDAEEFGEETAEFDGADASDSNAEADNESDVGDARGDNHLVITNDDAEHVQGNRNIGADICDSTAGADICSETYGAGICTKHPGADVSTDIARADICTENSRTVICTNEVAADVCADHAGTGTCINTVEDDIGSDNIGAGICVDNVSTDGSGGDVRRDCVVIVMDFSHDVSVSDTNGRQGVTVSEPVETAAVVALNRPNNPGRDAPELNPSPNGGESDNSSTNGESDPNNVPQNNSSRDIKKKTLGERKSKIRVCNICGTKTRGKQKTMEHMNVHTGERPFVCSVCGRGFSRKSERKYHSRSHEGDLYTCEVCGKGFTKAFTLKKHSTIHTGEKPHPCAVCGKHFRLKGDLATHSKTHMERKPYRHLCSICGKTFRKVSIMREHMKVHTGEKPHLCKICGKTFAQKATLNDHIRMHENGLLYCSFCEKTYRRRQSLSCHIRKMHQLNY